MRLSRLFLPTPTYRGMSFPQSGAAHLRLTNVLAMATSAIVALTVPPSRNLRSHSAEQQRKPLLVKVCLHCAHWIAKPWPWIGKKYFGLSGSEGAKPLSKGLNAADVTEATVAVYAALAASSRRTYRCLTSVSLAL